MSGSKTMGDAEEYARLMAAFDRLEDASPSERALRLQAYRDREPTLARALDELWAARSLNRTALEEDVRLSAIIGPSLYGQRSGSGSDSSDARERPLPAELGEVLGHYRLTEIIGRGGMGCVYRAVHTELGGQVAVKVLEPLLSEDPLYLPRFTREAKLVAAIQHPNIVQVYDFIEMDSPRRVAFVMELLEGPTLTQFLEQRALKPMEAVAAGLQLLDALKAVHEEGVVHRDLKPDNVMIVGALDGHEASPTPFFPSVKLLDFGIAKVPEPMAMYQTATGVLMGTPAYMAPEQFAAEPPTPAADVYAWAEVFYEMLAREPLYRERGIKLVRQKLSGVCPDLKLPRALEDPGGVGELLRSCLETAPADRPSVARVQRRLANLPMGRSPAQSSLRDSVRSPRRWTSRHRGPALALGLLVGTAALLSAMAVGVWLAPADPAPVGRDLATESSPPAESAPPAAVLEALPEAAEADVPRAQLPAIVYGEPAANTPFVPGGYMGDPRALTVDASWAEAPHSGSTSFRVSYGPERGWAGLAWLDPPDDWGERPGGLSMEGASELSFWARSDLDGMEVKFGFGLVMRDAAFFDSSRQERVSRLTRAWTRYSFDLRGKNLSRIKSAFYFALDSPGPGGPHSFYLDDIKYE
ncbi:MAG: protein kinase [Myxococcota bacterium]